MIDYFSGPFFLCAGKDHVMPCIDPVCFVRKGKLEKFPSTSPVSTNYFSFLLRFYYFLRPTGMNVGCAVI